MRAPWLRVALLSVAVGCGVAQASETDCYSIKDQDRKNLCLATSKRQVSYCYAIKNADSKHMCLARVDLKKSNCHSIKDKDSQKECLAMFR